MNLLRVNETKKRHPQQLRAAEADPHIREARLRAQVEAVVDTGQTRRIVVSSGAEVVAVTGEEYDILCDLAELSILFQDYTERGGAPSAEPTAWLLFLEAIHKFDLLQRARDKGVSMNVVNLLKMADDLT